MYKSYARKILLAILLIIFSLVLYFLKLYQKDLIQRSIMDSNIPNLKDSRLYYIYCVLEYNKEWNRPIYGKDFGFKQECEYYIYAKSQQQIDDMINKSRNEYQPYQGQILGGSWDQ